MQKRAVVVNVAAALLGVAVAALGLAAEYFKHQALVRSDVSRCQYRRTPALACGVLAALLSVTAVTLVTTASRCFGRFGGAAAPAPETWRRNLRTAFATLAWLLVVAAAALFLYGASRNAGGTGGFTATRRPGVGGNSGGPAFYFVCAELADGVFVRASIAAGFAIGFAISAYIDLVQKREKTITLGVAMERLHWSQQPSQP